jgi:cytochrome c oxidase accessory protein FixG
LRTSKNIFDLDPERLATTDEHGDRIFLHPESVKGAWQRRRSIVYWFLIGLYLILPWINVNGRPAVQVNIFKREFVFFGGVFHGVEPILIFLAVISGLFFIAFMTSVFGRVWCGWACPQTVFIQSIFLKLEALIEGTPKQRRDLDASPWNSKKILKRGAKWAVFTLVSLHIANTFIGYMVGPRELVSMTLHSPGENWGLFSATMILAAIFLWDFGWFREQFCSFMCPYGRIQSVMMDENSLVVAYDKKRGEPRFGTVPKGEEGDCINCFHCVKVCPVGIDIRRGTQLECIHCTLCIDACDNIMARMNKPHGLIKYASENGEKHKVLTPRSFIYACIGIILMGVFLFSLNASKKLDLVFIRSKIPYTVAREGKIMNNFQLKISHQGDAHPRIDFRIKDPELNAKIKIITPSHPTIVDEAEKKIVFFFRFDPSVLSMGGKKITVEIEDIDSHEVIAEKEVSLAGPVQ